MRKQTLNVISLALILALLLSVAAVLPVTGQDSGMIRNRLDRLYNELEGEKPALQNKVNALIHQIEAGAFNGALNKMENDVRDAIIAWVEDSEELVKLVDEIIDLIKGITPPPPKPDFEVSTPPYRLDVLQGAFNTTIVTITSINNFSQEVILTGTTTASDVTLSFDPETMQPLPNASATSMLKVEASENATPGEYEITVTGKSGSTEHAVVIPLRIIEAPQPPPKPKDFTLSASPVVMTIQQGRANTSIVTVTSVNGFDRQVDLTVTSALITGVNATLNPDKVTPPADTYGISALVIAVAPSAGLGTYIITVTGTSDSIQHQVNVTLTVVKPPVPPQPDFSLNVFPTSLTIEQGDTATSTIVVTSLRGFSGLVTLTETAESILGVTISLNPTQVTLSPNEFATSTLKIEVATDAALEDSAVLITATSGALQRNATLSFTIILEKKPPKILSVLRQPEDAPAYNETVTVVANVVDLESGIKNIMLSYTASATTRETAMTLDSGLYQATIPAFPYNIAVDYRVVASDNVGNSATSSTYSYTVTDPYPPTIGTITWSPQEPAANQDIKVNVTVTEPEDASGIDKVILRYSNGTLTVSKLMTDNHDGNWTAIIANQTNPKIVFVIETIDHAENTLESKIQEITLAAPASPLAWILAAITILAAATGGGAYYVNRKRKKGKAPTPSPSATVQPIPSSS